MVNIKTNKNIAEADTGSFLKKGCSQKLRKIHRETFVLRSLFDQVTSPSQFIPSENTRKQKVFWYFQGDKMGRA